MGDPGPDGSEKARLSGTGVAVTGAGDGAGVPLYGERMAELVLGSKSVDPFFGLERFSKEKTGSHSCRLKGLSNGSAIGGVPGMSRAPGESR